MRTLLHVLNPVVVDAGSDLCLAQPVTFAAMADARRWAEVHGLDVRQCAVAYPEDTAAIPENFHRLPDLTRSVLDVARFRQPRKLPLLADILARAIDAADVAGAETIIYTNVDIAPMPDFYLAVAAWLDRGYDAFTICRRTLAKDWPGGVGDLPLMRAQLGTPHPGRDCFVFGRQAARRYDLRTVCIGASPVGKALAANLLCHASNYEDFRDAHLTFHLGEDRVWQTPERDDYLEHNRRELLAILAAMRAAGLGNRHPAWAKLVSRLDAPSER